MAGRPYPRLDELVKGSSGGTTDSLDGTKTTEQNHPGWGSTPLQNLDITAAINSDWESGSNGVRNVNAGS